MKITRHSCTSGAHPSRLPKRRNGAAPPISCGVRCRGRRGSGRPWRRGVLLWLSHGVRCRGRPPAAHPPPRDGEAMRGRGVRCRGRRRTSAAPRDAAPRDGAGPVARRDGEAGIPRDGGETRRPRGGGGARRLGGSAADSRRHRRLAPPTWWSAARGVGRGQWLGRGRRGCGQGEDRGYVCACVYMQCVPHVSDPSPLASILEKMRARSS